jgi:hypothetical protein
MSAFYSRIHYEETAAFVRASIHHRPAVGLVLNSGLGELPAA